MRRASRATAVVARAGPPPRGGASLATAAVRPCRTVIRSSRASWASARLLIPVPIPCSAFSPVVDGSSSPGARVPEVTASRMAAATCCQAASAEAGSMATTGTSRCSVNVVSVQCTFRSARHSRRRWKTPLESGMRAGERDRTADLPFTRQPLSMSFLGTFSGSVRCRRSQRRPRAGT